MNRKKWVSIQKKSKEQAEKLINVLNEIHKVNTFFNSEKENKYPFPIYLN